MSTISNKQASSGTKPAAGISRNSNNAGATKQANTGAVSSGAVVSNTRKINKNEGASAKTIPTDGLLHSGQSAAIIKTPQVPSQVNTTEISQNIAPPVSNVSSEQLKSVINNPETYNFGNGLAVLMESLYLFVAANQKVADIATETAANQIEESAKSLETEQIINGTAQQKLYDGTTSMNNDLGRETEQYLHKVEIYSATEAGLDIGLGAVSFKTEMGATRDNPFTKAETGINAHERDIKNFSNDFDDEISKNMKNNDFAESDDKNLINEKDQEISKAEKEFTENENKFKEITANHEKSINESKKLSEEDDNNAAKTPTPGGDAAESDGLIAYRETLKKEYVDAKNKHDTTQTELRKRINELKKERETTLDKTYKDTVDKWTAGNSKFSEDQKARMQLLLKKHKLQADNENGENSEKISEVDKELTALENKSNAGYFNLDDMEPTDTLCYKISAKYNADLYNKKYHKNNGYDRFSEEQYNDMKKVYTNLQQGKFKGNKENIPKDFSASFKNIDSSFKALKKDGRYDDKDILSAHNREHYAEQERKNSEKAAKGKILQQTGDGLIKAGANAMNTINSSQYNIDTQILGNDIQLLNSSTSSVETSASQQATNSQGNQGVVSSVNSQISQSSGDIQAENSAMGALGGL